MKCERVRISDKTFQRTPTNVRALCDQIFMLTKRQRLDEVFRRLAAAEPANTAAGALALLARVINGVEDELSGLPYDQLASRTMVAGQRMYPPLPDSRMPAIIVGVERYSAAQHDIMVGANGAILIIRRRSGDIELSKSGADGKEIES